MELMNQIIARAKADMQRIVLPEGTEERTLKAADKLIADKVAHITLIGNPAEIMALAEKHGLQDIGNAIIVDPKNHERKEEIKSEHVPASCHDPAVLRDVRDRLRAL